MKIDGIDVGEIYVSEQHMTRMKSLAQEAIMYRRILVLGGYAADVADDMGASYAALINAERICALMGWEDGDDD